MVIPLSRLGVDNERAAGSESEFVTTMCRGCRCAEKLACKRLDEPREVGGVGHLNSWSMPPPSGGVFAFVEAELRALAAGIAPKHHAQRQLGAKKVHCR